MDSTCMLWASAGLTDGCVSPVTTAALHSYVERRLQHGIVQLVQRCSWKGRCKQQTQLLPAQDASPVKALVLSCACPGYNAKAR